MIIAVRTARWSSFTSFHAEAVHASHFHVFDAGFEFGFIFLSSNHGGCYLGSLKHLVDRSGMGIRYSIRGLGVAESEILLPFARGAEQESLIVSEGKFAQQGW